MSAAKFSARCSDRLRTDREENEDSNMSRIGKKPVAVPQGVTANVDGQTVTAKGPKGELKFVVNDEVLVKLEDGDDRRRAARPDQGCPLQVGHVAHADPEHPQRREERFREEARDHRRRLPCRHAGQEPAARTRLQPRRRLPDARRRARSPFRSRRRSSSTASTSSWSVRSQPKSAKYRGPEPYKGKGVRYAGERIVRKEGKKK